MSIPLLIFSYIPWEYDFKQEWSNSNKVCCHKNTPKLVVLFLGP